MIYDIYIYLRCAWDHCEIALQKAPPLFLNLPYRYIVYLSRAWLGKSIVSSIKMAQKTSSFSAPGSCAHPAAPDCATLAPRRGGRSRQSPLPCHKPRGSGPRQPRPAENKRLLSQLSRLFLCLSRACLGILIGFSMKSGPKKGLSAPAWVRDPTHFEIAACRRQRWSRHRSRLHVRTTHTIDH
jgi:hypothetical protein